ncbi:MAG: preprotein translocase subunit YajC [Flavobacteriales bacterium]|jgi:preprotein translocase subunit YajC|tara:strand:+ start:306 stop:608 length:303 start_codon:yes stop_codon:yes gene_type:complete
MGDYSTLLMFGMIAIVFYFFMIRPQMKKQKEQKQFKSAVKKGDKIVTIGGIHAKIKEVNETTVMVETDGGAKMRIEKSAISMDYSSGKSDGGSAEIEEKS